MTLDFLRERERERYTYSNKKMSLFVISKLHRTHILLVLSEVLMLILCVHYQWNHRKTLCWIMTTHHHNLLSQRETTHQIPQYCGTTTITTEKKKKKVKCADKK